MTGVFAERFGDGWLSRRAVSLIRITVAFGGYPEAELVRRVAFAGTSGRTTNSATVLRILQELENEARD